MRHRHNDSELQFVFTGKAKSLIVQCCEQIGLASDTVGDAVVIVFAAVLTVLDEVVLFCDHEGASPVLLFHN